MAIDEASSPNDLFEQLENEAGVGEEGVIRSPVNQWMVVCGVVIAGTLLSTLVGAALHGEGLNALYVFQMIFLWFNAVCGVLEIAFSATLLPILLIEPVQRILPGLLKDRKQLLQAHLDYFFMGI